MGDFKQWSEGWIKEGYYLSYESGGVTYYERCIMRDLGHFEWPWGWDGKGTATPIPIDAGEDSGPYVPEDLEITRGYDKDSGLNQIWQLIFGIKGEVLIYLELPTDLKRHGIPKRAWPNREFRRVAHFEEWMSPFNEPTFLTEHFMKRPETQRIDFSAYNPNAIDLTDVTLNFFLNKIVTERIGTQSYTEGGLQLKPTRSRFQEVLTKLHQELIPCRPLSILPVRAPPEAPAGE